MNEMFSVEELAERVNAWCERHGVLPASGQAGERITVRNIRYYRTLGLLDAPLLGGGRGFGEKHRLQLAAIRLLQAQGLPLNRIQELLFGRTLEELQRIEKQGLAELEASPFTVFRPAANESWHVTPLNEEFMVVSRRGRALPADLRERLLAALAPKPQGKRPVPGRMDREGEGS
jgi:DNA-binding transcriptional MerR regulator